MKLDTIATKNAFDYGYLLKRIYPYIKPLMLRIVLTFLLAIPLGLLDGVTAFALKPYMDCVINGKTWNLGGLTLEQNTLAIAIPFGIILFAVVEGALKYANNYLTDWTGNKISNSLKIKLFSYVVLIPAEVTINTTYVCTIYE